MSTNINKILKMTFRVVDIMVHFNVLFFSNVWHLILYYCTVCEDTDLPSWERV